MIVGGKIKNYVFVQVRLLPAPGADLIKLRVKEPHYRDALEGGGAAVVDLPDHAILSRNALLSTWPADAADEIQAVCDYISPKPGGRGAVRDVIEQVMKAQGVWASWI